MYKTVRKKKTRTLLNDIKEDLNKMETHTRLLDEKTKYSQNINSLQVNLNM